MSFLVDFQSNIEKIKSNLSKNLTKITESTVDNLDTIFEVAHNKEFAKMNCLKCANCCRNYSPILEQEDLNVLQSTLNIDFVVLTEKYVEMDEDGDFVFKMQPCPMLNLENNKCTIYENRPKACRDYPHTNMKNIATYIDLLETNILICPAVVKIVEEVNTELKK